MSVLLMSFNSEKDEWEIWEELKTEKSGDAYVYSIMQRMKHSDEAWAWFVPEYMMDILSELQSASVGHRKNFYRLYLNKSLNKSNRMSSLSMNGRMTAALLTQDFEHFYKYLENIRTPQLQYSLKQYIIQHNSDLDYDELTRVKFPIEFKRLKELDRRVYLIAKAEYNKLRTGHRVRYKMHDRRTKRRRKSKN